MTVLTTSPTDHIEIERTPDGRITAVKAYDAQHPDKPAFLLCTGVTMSYDSPNGQGTVTLSFNAGRVKFIERGWVEDIE